LRAAWKSASPGSSVGTNVGERNDTNGLASISDSVPEFVVTKEASLHMDDVPQNLGSVPVTKTMWQTDMIAIRLKFRLSWILRDPRAVAWVNEATLIFVAGKARDKTRALPELDRLPVDELSGFADRLLIVSALYYGSGAR
jgi:hypothetical protein